MHESDACTSNPYLTFNGNCEEAMMFYKEALGGELSVMRFEGSPVEVSDDYQQKVLHSTLTYGNAVLMASDGMEGEPCEFGSANYISISCSTLEEAERFFKNLSQGGEITMPWDDTFWGDKFGMLVDKFGVGWMVSCRLESE